MTTISRINTSISDHNVAANSVAMFILVCISVFSAIVTIHTGNLVKSSYNTLLQSTPATQQVTETPASKVQSNQQASTLVLGESDSSLAHLQPAINPANLNQYSTVRLQPNNSGVQYLQNAATIQ